jgi:hypothetical protein
MGARPTGPLEFKQPESAPEFVACWAILEIFGHTKHAGKLSSVTVAGAGFVRIEIPALPAKTRVLERAEYVRDPATARSIMATPGATLGLSDEPASEKVYNPTAIFSIAPVSEATARAVAEQLAGRDWFLISNGLTLEAPKPAADDSLPMHCAECNQQLVNRDSSHPGLCDECYELQQDAARDDMRDLS